MILDNRTTHTELGIRTTEQHTWGLESVFHQLGLIFLFSREQQKHFNFFSASQEVALENVDIVSVYAWRSMFLSKNKKHREVRPFDVY